MIYITCIIDEKYTFSCCLIVNVFLLLIYSLCSEHICRSFLDWACKKKKSKMWNICDKRTDRQTDGHLDHKNPLEPVNLVMQLKRCHFHPHFAVGYESTCSLVNTLLFLTAWRDSQAQVSFYDRDVHLSVCPSVCHKCFTFLTSSFYMPSQENFYKWVLNRESKLIKEIH
jgi:hypothetical protein